MGPAGVDLAPYRSNLVSLPASLEGSPNLADLLPPEVRVFLDGEHELMRRMREETRALVEEDGVVRPYMDSALRHNRKRYLTFLRQLRSRGVLKFVEQAKAHAGVCFLSGSLLKTSSDSSLTLDREICSSRLSLPWVCVRLRHFLELRSNGTICGLMMKNDSSQSFTDPHGVEIGRRARLLPSHEDPHHFGSLVLPPASHSG